MSSENGQSSAPPASRCYAAEFVKDGGSIELSWDSGSDSIRIVAKGYGKTATRLCDQWVPEGLAVDLRALFVRDIEACVRALLDYRK